MSNEMPASYETPEKRAEAKKLGEENVFDIVREVEARLEEGLFEKKDIHTVLASLKTAGLLASDPNTKATITQMIDHIEERYREN